MGVSRKQAITILSEMKTNKSGLYIYTDAVEYEAHVSRNAAIDLAISDMKKAEQLEAEKSLYSDKIEIPDGEPLNTTISPEEVKDIAAKYDANQVTKIISMNKAALSEYKDMEIVEELKEKLLDVLTDKQNIEIDYAVFMDDYNELKAAKERDEAIIERLTASVASKRMLVDGLLGENIRLKNIIENIKTEIKNKSYLGEFKADDALEIIDRNMREC